MSHGWGKHLWDVSLAQIMEFNKVSLHLQHKPYTLLLALNRTDTELRNCSPTP